MTQYAKLAIAKNVRAKSMKAVARGHFALPPGGAFSDMIDETAIGSPGGEDVIRAIAREAESK